MMVLKDIVSKNIKLYRICACYLIVCSIMFQLMFATTHPVQAATTVTVYPTEDTSILKNPNRGFVGTAGGGGISSSLFSQNVWDRMSVGYLRCNWSSLESTEGNYNWYVIDSSISVCALKGSKLALGIMCADVNTSTYSYATPAWVFAAGAQYTLECDGKVKVPVWDDPIFKTKLQNFITALKNKYNNNKNIEFIDIRNYGNWGEWHLYGLPNSAAISEAQQASHVDMWSSYSKNLMIPTNGTILEYAAQYAMDTYKAGVRRDGCVNPDYPTHHRALSYAYDKVPTAAEWWNKYSSLKSGGKWQPVLFEKTLKEGKPSYMGLSIWDENTFYSEQSQLVNRWVNRVGYWLKMTKAAYPSDLGNGTAGNFTFQVKNDGVAPIYPNRANVGYVKLALMDNNNNVLQTVALTGVNPYNWKPNTYTTETASFSFAQNSNGTKLAVGVFTNASLTNPDVKLGTTATTVNNWYILNSMPTVEQNDLSANKIYSASNEWAEESFGYHEARYPFNGIASWVADAGAGSWLEVDFGENKAFTQAYLKENAARISGYKIQYYDGTNWNDAYTGTTIGTSGITVSFSEKTAKKARLYITATSGWPDINAIKILK